MRQSKLPQREVFDNGEALEGDDQADASFDPAAFEDPASPKPAASGSAPDPFDPASLRLSQHFGAGLGVKKALGIIPVRKPPKSDFNRTHPNEAYTLQTYVIELKEDREIYLVKSTLWSDLAIEPTFSPRALFTAVNRQGVLFLWPARLPGADGKLDSWSQSSLEAAQRARTCWVRVAANMSLGAYEVWEATGDLPEPDWPALPFGELLKIAFRGKYIDTLDHPVLRKLRGEV